MNTSTEDLISCLDGMKRAIPSPFFASRVMYKIQLAIQSPPSPGRGNLAWVVSVVVLIVALNLMLFFSRKQIIDDTIYKWRSSTPNWVVDFTENPGSSIYDIPHK